MLGSIVNEMSIKVLGLVVPSACIVLRTFVLESSALNRKPPVFSPWNRLVIVAQIRVVGSVLALGVGLRLVNMKVLVGVVVVLVSP